MRFPLRLTANLAVGRVSRACSFNSKDSSAIFDLCSDETVPPGCRVVWIGGPDPLARAEVARLVNSSAASGRYVFLSINGARLRRRIHEFQPSSRLYLTIRFDVGRCVSDRVARVDLLAVALDAVRAANLSGFHACAQLVLHSAGEAVGLTKLHAELSKLHLDGMLISPAAPDAGLMRSVEEARRRLLTRGWARFSRLLDPLLPLLRTEAMQSAPPASRTVLQAPRNAIANLPPADYEESVPAP